MGYLAGHFPPGLFPFRLGQSLGAFIQVVGHLVVCPDQHTQFIIRCIMDVFRFTGHIQAADLFSQFCQWPGDLVRKGETHHNSSHKQEQVKVNNGSHNGRSILGNIGLPGQVGDVDIGHKISVCVVQRGIH